MPTDKNPILEIYMGLSVRACNPIVLKVGPVEFKKILDEVAKSSKLSPHKVLAYSGKCCDSCQQLIKTDEYDDEGNLIYIKRISLKMPEKNGVNIINQAKNKNNLP